MNVNRRLIRDWCCARLPDLWAAVNLFSATNSDRLLVAVFMVSYHHMRRRYALCGG